MNRLILLFLPFFTGWNISWSSERILPGNFIIYLTLKTHDTAYFNRTINSHSFDAGTSQKVKFENSEWDLSLSLTESGSRDATDIEAIFICTKGKLEAASVAVDFIKNNWNESNYVLVPAALYNGNRYPWRRIQYSPKLMDPRDIGPDKGIIVRCAKTKS